MAMPVKIVAASWEVAQTAEVASLGFACQVSPQAIVFGWILSGRIIKSRIQPGRSLVYMPDKVHTSKAVARNMSPRLVC